MRFWIITLLLTLMAGPVWADRVTAPEPVGIDATINSLIAPVADFLSAVIFYAVEMPFNGATAKVPLIVVWLICAGLFFTVYLRFINLRGFGHALNLVRGKYQNTGHPGEVSHFQALATALSGTVGLGNIAGVAVAVTIGGPGATFWMILAGVMGMSLKFAECTLGVKYRNQHADGSVSGGPMYTLSKGLAEIGLARTGKVLAILFAVCCVGGAFGGGNMFQVNQTYQQILNVTSGTALGLFLAGNAWAFGLFMAFLVGVVIIGGIKSIARVTDKLVPFMCLTYLFAGLAVLVVNASQLPQALLTILGTAFNPDPAMVTGGLLGALVAGFRRAAFSNEAGFGSAAIAHAAVRTREPVTEGLVSLLEPFIDTVIICTMTALVIVVTGVYDQTGVDGVTLTSQAFATVLPWFPKILALVVFLFAYSTMISWSYYGNKAWSYLFGEGKGSDLLYKSIFCLFVVVGCTMKLDKVLDFSDSMMFAMSIFNIIGLYLLAGILKADLAHYWQRYKAGHFEIRAGDDPAQHPHL